MRLHEVIEKLQKNEMWEVRPKGYWRYGEEAHLAVVGMSDHPVVFYGPFDEMRNGELKKQWQWLAFVPTFEDFKRDDWGEYKGEGR